MREWILFVLTVLVGADHDYPEFNWPEAPQGGEDGTILRVHVLFRHGQRVPKSIYPTDPNFNASLWLDGFSQLTNEGRRQGYALGVGLRRRYGSIIPPVRAWRNVSAQSSAIARTMMTAEVVLAGLLPPQQSDRWSHLNWQPVPVFTRTDATLSTNVQCPRLEAIIDQHTEPSESIREMRKYLEKHTKLPVHSGNAVQKLYTCFSIEEEVGLNLPAWTRKVYPEPMRSEAGRSLGMSAITTVAARLRAGPLLAELGNFSIRHIGEPIRLYSTHDNVLAGLLRALGLYTGIPPGFVSTLALEYRLVNQRVHVQLWWRNAAGDPLQRVKLPGCGKRCPLSEFVTILRPLIPQDWAEECKLPDMDDLFMLATACILLSALMFLILLIHCGFIQLYRQLV